MNFERMVKIVEFNKKNAQKIDERIDEVLSDCQSNKMSFLLNFDDYLFNVLYKRNVLVIIVPLDDNEIGAVTYKGDKYKYLILNSSLPYVNNRFSLAHELYHIYQKNTFNSKIELNKEQYILEPEELEANCFAGMLLMPQSIFCTTFKTRMEEYHDLKKTIAFLSSYFKVPFMASLIRAIELDLFNIEEMDESYFDITLDELKSIFDDLLLNSKILESSFADNIEILFKAMKKVGNKNVNDEFIKESFLNKCISNCERIIKELRGNGNDKLSWNSCELY